MLYVFGVIDFEVVNAMGPFRFDGLAALAIRYALRDETKEPKNVPSPAPFDAKVRPVGVCVHMIFVLVYGSVVLGPVGPVGPVKSPILC